MVCPKCGKEDIGPRDAFCRHCGFCFATSALLPESAGGVVEKKSVTGANSGASTGLQLFGAAILVMVPFVVLAVAPWIGWLNFVGSVLPFLFGALTLVGLALIFIGFELRRVH